MWVGPGHLCVFLLMVVENPYLTCWRLGLYTMGRLHKSIGKRLQVTIPWMLHRVGVKQLAMCRAWTLLWWPCCGMQGQKKRLFGFSWLWFKITTYGACLKLLICTVWRCVPSQLFNWFIKRCQTSQRIWRSICKIRWVCSSQIGCWLYVLAAYPWCPYHIFGMNFLTKAIQ